MPPNPSCDPAPYAEASRTTLLDWYRTSARRLPWREPFSPDAVSRDSLRRDPWRVWVAEVMLQQTRVEAVIAHFIRFLEVFPTLAALAEAQQDDVLAHWSGLGYYRRARLLHAGARYVVTEHGGRIPRTRGELEAVPGIGAYTAGAILSLAFAEREPAVDANVSRVVARLLAVEDARSAQGRRQIACFATALVDCEDPGDVNEALMDLGSAICTAKVARCTQCPLAQVCLGRAGGDPLSFAAPRPRKPPRLVELACAVVRDGDRVLFLRRPDKEAILAGMWDLPTVEIPATGGDNIGEAPELELQKLIRQRTGVSTDLRDGDLTVRHEIVGRKIVARVYVAGLVSVSARDLPSDARLLPSLEIFGKAGDAGVGLPALPIRILRALRRLSPPQSS